MAAVVTEAGLRAFVEAYREQPWQPGKIDCCLFLAAWAIWLGHPDPAEHLRGTYDSDEGFRTIVERAGGVVCVVARCVAKIGGKRVQRASCGDIGVIGNTKDLRCQFGAIFDGNRWLIRTPEGVRSFTASPLASWTIA